jgi:HAD superfamily hydrolase (TIGR01490 family)
VRIAFFDVDHTLVRGSTAWHCIPLFKQEKIFSYRGLLFLAVAHLRHRLGILDYEDVYKKGIKPFVGLEAERVLKGMEECFRRFVYPHIFVEALQRIEMHKKNKDMVVLLSASPVYLLQHFKTHIGVDECIGFRQIIEGGRFIDDFERPIPYGPNKLKLAMDFANRHGVSLANCAFYTDSSSDLLLLRHVGEPYAVNPNLRLYIEARRHNWQVLRFRKTIGKPLG